MRGKNPYTKARNFGKGTTMEGFALGGIKIYRKLITIFKVCYRHSNRQLDQST